MIQIPTKLTVSRAGTVLAAMLATASISQAQITGTVYEGVPAADNTDDPGNYSSSLPNAQFITTGINYNSDVTGYTVTTFLNNPTFFNQNNGFDPNADDDNTAIIFSGSLFLASGDNSFSILHDDGINLTINGNNIVDDPGGTPATESPFIVNNPGPAGDFPFVLDYTECCGPPAVLEFAINNQIVGTPDVSATMPLLGMGMLGLAAFARRIRK